MIILRKCDKGNGIFIQVLPFPVLQEVPVLMDNPFYFLFIRKVPPRHMAIPATWYQVICSL